MFTSILILIPFLTIALLPVAIRTRFSCDELIEMGVCLEDFEAAQPDYSIQQPDCLLPNANILCGNA
jgi:hypothetical protein